jgi:hypothetical protein
MFSKNMSSLFISFITHFSRIAALYAFIGLLTLVDSFAQDNPVTELTYYATEDVKTQSPPAFPGGHKALETFIRNELTSSPDKVKLGRKEYITVKIDEQGKVTELKSAYNADPALEKELKRIASLMPAWQAGTVNGKGVMTDYTFLLKRR